MEKTQNLKRFKAWFMIEELLTSDVRLLLIIDWVRLHISDTGWMETGGLTVLLSSSLSDLWPLTNSDVCRLIGKDAWGRRLSISSGVRGFELPFEYIESVLCNTCSNLRCEAVESFWVLLEHRSGDEEGQQVGLGEENTGDCDVNAGVRSSSISVEAKDDVARKHVSQLAVSTPESTDSERPFVSISEEGVGGSLALRWNHSESGLVSSVTQVSMRFPKLLYRFMLVSSLAPVLPGWKRKISEAPAQTTHAVICRDELEFTTCLLIRLCAFTTPIPVTACSCMLIPAPSSLITWKRRWLRCNAAEILHLSSHL